MKFNHTEAENPRKGDSDVLWTSPAYDNKFKQSSSEVSCPKSQHSDHSLQVVRVVKPQTFPHTCDTPHSTPRSPVSASRILPTLPQNCNSSSRSCTYRTGDAYSSDHSQGMGTYRVGAARCQGSQTYRLDDAASSVWDSSSSSSMSWYSPGQCLPEVASTCSSHPSWQDEIDDLAALTQFRPLTFRERLKSRAVTNIRGHTNQASIESEYVGQQCTMMSLYAVSYHSHRPMGCWTSDVIDRIIDRGDVHHAMYCDQYSNKPDGRIALDELPKAKTTQLIYDWHTKVIVNAYAGEHSGVVFLTQTPLTRGLHRPSLKTYIKAQSADKDDAAFVITVWDYSYGIVAASDGYFYLFDSHGNLHIEEPVFQPQVAEDLEGQVGGASLTRFETLDALVDTLKVAHNDGAPCEARLITAMPRLSLHVDGEEKSLPSLPRKPEARMLPTASLSPNVPVLSKPPLVPKPPAVPRTSTFSRASVYLSRSRPTSTAPPISNTHVDDVGLDDTIDLD